MSLLGKAAVLIWNDVIESGQTSFYEWHDKEHIPERLGLPGFLRGRRYRGKGTAEWLTVYEASDLSVLTSEAYVERLNNPTPATSQNLVSFRNTARSICAVEVSIGESTGGHALTIDLPGIGAQAGIIEDTMRAALTLTGVLSVHLLRADEAASRLDTRESRERTYRVPPRILFLECSTPTAANAALDAIAAAFGADAESIRATAGLFVLEISRLHTTRRIS